MDSTTDHRQEAWEIFWVINQWPYIYERWATGSRLICGSSGATGCSMCSAPSRSLKDKLPPWANLKMVDESRPLEDQACCCVHRARCCLDS